MVNLGRLMNKLVALTASTATLAADRRDRPGAGRCDSGHLELFRDRDHIVQQSRQLCVAATAIRFHDFGSAWPDKQWHRYLAGDGEPASLHGRQLHSHDGSALRAVFNPSVCGRCEQSGRSFVQQRTCRDLRF